MLNTYKTYLTFHSRRWRCCCCLSHKQYDHVMVLTHRQHEQPEPSHLTIHLCTSSVFFSQAFEHVEVTGSPPGTAAQRANACTFTHSARLAGITLEGNKKKSTRTQTCLVGSKKRTWADNIIMKSIPGLSDCTKGQFQPVLIFMVRIYSS